MAKNSLSLVQNNAISFVDLRFTDLRGVWQHMTIPARVFTEEMVQKGFGFDGSSIKGFSTIFESDMLLKPDIATLFVDPFYPNTAICICDVYDPDTGMPFNKDPRGTAKKAEAYLKSTGIADTSYWGPELEFFVFDGLNVQLSPYVSGVRIRSHEVPLGEFLHEEGDGYRILTKTGYFPVPPFDRLQAFRSEMVTILEEIGVAIEVHHHEVATGGQVEIDMRYDTLVSMADKVMKYKYVARNLAQKYGMTVSFLPKPIFGDNGSGMHTHQSLFKKNRNLFFDPKGYGELSQTGMSYLAGLLSNIGTVLALSNPTLNSYRRLVPHFEAPTSIAFSKRNRSAAIRIPMYYKNEENAKRIEFRCPDPTCNPYLSFAAMLVFGLSGVEKKLDPKKLGFGPFEENIWENAAIKQTPNNLFAALTNLGQDKLLVKSGVFSKDLIQSYLEVKHAEMHENLLYPTPADFWFYGDI